MDRKQASRILQLSRNWVRAGDRTHLLAVMAVLLLVPVLLGADESLSDRRKRVEGMTEKQKDDLFRNERQFRSLSENEQQRIRRLHEALESAPDAARLRETMIRYCQWLASQPPFRRAELAEMKPQQRIKHIKQLLQEQGRAGSRLGDADRQALLTWMNRYATQHEAKLLESPGDNPRWPKDKPPQAMRHGMAMMTLFRRLQANNPAGQPLVSESEMSQLRESLSPEARKRLESKPLPEQVRAVAAWLHDAVRWEVGKRRGDRSTWLAGFEEQLAEFFESDKISKEDRDRLMSLPGEEMQQRLRELYFSRPRPGGGEFNKPDFGKRNGAPQGPGGRARREGKDGKEGPRGKEPRDNKGRPPENGPREKTPPEKP